MYRNHMWAPLLEKAWAKMMGNYYFTQNASPAVALRALTGAPVMEKLAKLSATDSTGIYEDIKASLKLMYPVTAKARVGANQLYSKLVDGRVYAVLATIDMTPTVTSGHPTVTSTETSPTEANSRL